MSSTIIKPSGKLNPWVFTSSFNLAYDAHFDADKVHQELWDSLCDRTLVLRCPWYELVNIEIIGINAQWGWKHPSESFGRNHQFRSRGAKISLRGSEKITRSLSPGAPERLPKHSRRGAGEGRKGRKKSGSSPWRGTYNMWLLVLVYMVKQTALLYCNNNNHNNIFSVELFTTASFLLMIQ